MLKFSIALSTNKKNLDLILKKYQKKVNVINKSIINKSSLGVEMTGWRNFDKISNACELSAMKNKANEWKKAKINTIVVVGIGGSYIGVKAAIDMVRGKSPQTYPKIIFIHNMSSDFLVPILNNLKNKKFAIIVISKSGTTLEPAVTFKLFRDLLEKNIGTKMANKYITAITDGEKGTLYNFAKAKKYSMFKVPNDIGGRYSTLTPVGIFPMLVAGLNINEILKGAKCAIKDLSSPNLKLNSAFLYACYRHYFYTKKNIQVENFITYEPSLSMMSYQWQQLFGESEGKDGLSMYPTCSLFTSDLHSMGQFLQEGTRNFIETTLICENPRFDLKLNVLNDDDGLTYLKNKQLSSLTQKAFEGTVDAHSKDGGIDNLIISITKKDEYHYGYLFTWLCNAAMMSGYLLNINPFNQPGVETYKKNMFKLLGKNN